MERIVALGGETRDACEVREAAVGATPLKDGEDIDGLRDERSRDGDDGFLNELFEAAQRADGGARMDRTDPAGMAGAPGFEEIERFGTAHLADGDAIRAQAKGGAHKIGQRRDAVLGAQCDQIGRRALQFAGVFDEDDAVGGLGDFGEQRIGERRLARGRPAGDKDVGTGRDGSAQRVGGGTTHDSGVDVIVEREDCDGGLADGEGWRCDDWRE